MELEDEREKKRKAEEDANAAAELKKKKEEYEAEKKTWDDEKAQLKTKIKAVEESINWAKKESKAAITRGLRTDDNKVKDCLSHIVPGLLKRLNPVDYFILTLLISITCFG